MEIQQTQTQPSVAPMAKAPTAAITSDFDTFLKMLTVQMENQDPLNPTDSAEYAMQLATFSGVEQQVLTNDLLNTLMVQLTATGMAQMADWVGRDARAPVPAHFDGTPITIAPDPASGADRAELVVYDASGTEVQRSVIPKPTDLLEWTGVGPNGAAFPTGVYTFHVESFQNAELLSDDVAAVYARVQEVRIENGESVLILNGDVPVSAANVSGLRDST